MKIENVKLLPVVSTCDQLYQCTFLLSFVGNLPSYQVKSERHHNIFVRDTVLLG